MKNLSRTVKTVFALTIFASVAFFGFYRSATVSANNNSIPAVSGKPISAYADLYVIIHDITDPATREFKTGVKSYEVVIDGKRYPAIVPANSRRNYTKLHIPIQGTLENGTITLEEAPFKILDPSKYAEKGVDEKSLKSGGVAAEVGGKIEYFQNRGFFESQLQKQIEWESRIGPEKPSASEQENDLSPWSEGTKQFLFIRINFTDDQDVIATPQEVLNIMNNEVSPFFVANSYNKTAIQTTVTPVFTMPHPRTYYNQPGYAIQIINDGRAAAEAAGYEYADYDLDVAAIKNNLNGMCYQGAVACASVGSKGMWLSGGGFTGKILAHELGHNYGMNHANEWISLSSYPIGAGYSIEYGDIFDVMGRADLPTGHFNGSYKSLLNWLNDGNVRTIVNNGTYRVFSHDNTTEGGIRALKIKKDDVKDYWLYRRETTNNPYLNNGVQLTWRENSLNFYSHLLDMHGPNVAGNSPMLVNESFTDNEDHIRFTVLDQYLPESVSVQVEFNYGCTYSLAQSSASFAASGGEGVITVNTQTGCAPMATDDSKWVQFLESKKGTNQSTVRYIVSPNYGAARAGTINVGGLTFTVNQSAQATACVAAPSGLIAWWQGEGNVLDQKLKYGGIAGDITKTFSGGKIGGGFRTLDVSAGNSATQAPIAFVPDAPALALNGSFTIEGWVRNDSAQPFASILKRGDPSFYKPSYAINLHDEKIVFTLESDSDPNVSVVASVQTAQIPLHQWMHFAATLDSLSGSMKIYLNGTVAQQIQTGVRPYQAMPNGKIMFGEGSFFWDYSMDELSLYNRALSASEVQGIYNAGTAPAGAAGKCPVSLVIKTPFDFDGDRKADMSVAARPGGDLIWQSLNSQTGNFELQFGYAGDKLVPADYDNDGKTDIAVYRDGTWYLQQSSAGFLGVQWGLPDDIPQPADFTGDGKPEITVFRPSNGTWYALNLVTGLYTAYQWGTSGDKPAVGDYDGDGLADYAVYRPSQGIWYLLQSTNGFSGIQFGIAADHTVAADYDGDGRTDIAVYREAASSEWYILRSSDSGVTAKLLGHTTDYPAPADFDGDGKTDIAVWQQGSGINRGVWSIVKSHNNQLVREYYGNPRDISVPTAFTNFPTN